MSAGRFWRNFLQFGNVLTVVLVVLTAANLLNMSPLRTFLRPADDPGLLLQNTLGDAFWWLAVVSVTLRVLLAVVTVQRIVQPWRTTYYWVHIIVAVLAFLLEIAFLALHIVEIQDCNEAGGPWQRNFCSDDRWCCVFGAVAPDAPTADCPYLLADCDPVVAQADLGWNGRFAWSFGLNIAAIVIMLVHLIITFVLGLRMVDMCYVRDPCRKAPLCVQREDTCTVSQYERFATQEEQDIDEFEAALDSYSNPETVQARIGASAGASGLMSRLVRVAGGGGGRPPAKEI